ncbi:hypothetical protein Tco_1578275, partial [Tanacetum coccineum]
SEDPSCLDFSISFGSSHVLAYHVSQESEEYPYSFHDVDAIDVKVLLRASVDISKGMFGLEGKTKGSRKGVWLLPKQYPNTTVAAKMVFGTDELSLQEVIIIERDEDGRKAGLKLKEKSFSNRISTIIVIMPIGIAIDSNNMKVSSLLLPHLGGGALKRTEKEERCSGSGAMNPTLDNGGLALRYHVYGDKSLINSFNAVENGENDFWATLQMLISGEKEM